VRSADGIGIHSLPENGTEAAPHRPLIGKREKNLLLRVLEEHVDLGLEANCAHTTAYHRMLSAMACHERTAEARAGSCGTVGGTRPRGRPPVPPEGLDPQAVLEAFLAWNREILWAADPPGVGNLAIDLTTVPYFGPERTHAVRAKKYRGTQCGFRLATMYLCHRGRRFTLHAVPVDQLPRKEDVVRALLEMEVDFLMPVLRTSAVRRALAETRHLYAWVGPHRAGGGPRRRTVYAGRGRTARLRHESRFDTKAARSLADAYDTRWGIESSMGRMPT